MPFESRSRPSSKPLTPSLSSNVRTRPGQQTALTPRLATSTLSPAQAISPTTAIPSRILRQRALSPEERERDNAPKLNSNITPRSGARTSRLDTDSPTTPDAFAGLGINPRTEDVSTTKWQSGLISPNQTPTQSRLKPKDSLSFLPTANGRRVSGGSTASASPRQQDSKFFRADDVKPATAAQKSQVTRPRTIHVTNTLPTATRISSEPDLDVQLKSPSSFYQIASLARGGAPYDSPTSFVGTSTTALPIDSLSVSTSDRSHERAATGSVISAPHVRRLSTAKSAVSSTKDRRRSSSFNVRETTADLGRSHRKSLSTSSAVPEITKSAEAASEITVASAPSYSALHAEPQAYSMDHGRVINVTVDGLQSSSENSFLDLCHLNKITKIATGDACAAPITVQGVRPPLRPRHTRGSSEATTMQPLSKEQLEAAANARRERKVLDLEISNSSLLAINRTLEKEMRKQSAELRRFRRLSRSGRLSYTPSNRMVSSASIATMATLDESDTDAREAAVSIGDSDEGSSDDGDDADEYDNVSDDNSSALTESSELIRRRAKDEKRLLQDLRRHQEILLASQKLSQSIQRCLNFSDEMIRDGQKALSYQIEPSELHVGGRVLHHDDDEALSEVDFDEYREGFKPRQGLLSPTVEKSGWIGPKARTTPAFASSVLDHSNAQETVTEGASPSSTMELSPVLLPMK